MIQLNEFEYIIKTLATLKNQGGGVRYGASWEAGCGEERITLPLQVRPRQE